MAGGKATTLSAKALAKTLDTGKVEEKWNRTQQMATDLNVATFAERKKPRQVVAQLSLACDQNTSKVWQMPEEQSLQVQLYTNRKTLRMIVSGLRCWHNFATNVLDYHIYSTLPLRRCADTVRYVAIFHKQWYSNKLHWTHQVCMPCVEPTCG